MSTQQRRIGERPQNGETVLPMIRQLVQDMMYRPTSPIGAGAIRPESMPMTPGRHVEPQPMLIPGNMKHPTLPLQPEFRANLDPTTTGALPHVPRRTPAPMIPQAGMPSVQRPVNPELTDVRGRIGAIDNPERPQMEALFNIINSFRGLNWSDPTQFAQMEEQRKSREANQKLQEREQLLRRESDLVQQDRQQEQDRIAGEQREYEIGRRPIQEHAEGLQLEAAATNVEAAKRKLSQPLIETAPAGSMIIIQTPDGKTERIQVPFKSNDEGFTLGAGQQRFDASGKLVATGLPAKDPVEPGTYMPLMDQSGNVIGAWNPKSGEFKQAPIEGGRKTPAKPGSTPEEQRASVSRLANEALATVNLLKTHKGMGGAVGMKGASSLWGLRDNPAAGSDEASYLKYIDTLKSQLALPNLQMLRGLGAMSDREFATITSAVTALHPDMKETDFVKELGNIESALNNTLQLMSSPMVDGESDFDFDVTTGTITRKNAGRTQN